MRRPILQMRRPILHRENRVVTVKDIELIALPTRCPFALIVAFPFVAPATARNRCALPHVRACRGDGVAAIAFAEPCRPARPSLIPTAAGARTSNRPKRRPAISMISDDILCAVSNDELCCPRPPSSQGSDPASYPAVSPASFRTNRQLSG
jgi:hypothetical protein